MKLLPFFLLVAELVEEPSAFSAERLRAVDDEDEGFGVEGVSSKLFKKNKTCEYDVSFFLSFCFFVFVFEKKNNYLDLPQHQQIHCSQTD